MSPPAAFPVSPSDDFQTGSSPRLQSSNAPNCAPVEPSRSPATFHRPQKTRCTALPRTPALRVLCALLLPPSSVIRSLNLAPARSTTSKSLRDDDSPPPDKTPSL